MFRRVWLNSDHDLRPLHIGHCGGKANEGFPLDTHWPMNGFACRHSSAQLPNLLGAFTSSPLRTEKNLVAIDMEAYRIIVLFRGLHRSVKYQELVLG